jgi:hypothetical protein
MEKDEHSKRIENLQQANENLKGQLDKLEKEAFANRNRNFIQLYRSQLSNLRALNSRCPMALTVLLILIEKMNKQNCIVMPVETLMKITGKSDSVIYNAIKVLSDNKFIKKTESDSIKFSVINSEVFWQDKATLKDRFELFSEPKVAESFDKKYSENWDKVKLLKVPFIDSTDS